MAVYRTRDGDMVDAICRRYYGIESGTVEAVLEANPGLADYGAVLPAGILVELPELPQSLKTIDTVKLWD